MYTYMHVAVRCRKYGAVRWGKRGARSKIAHSLR